MPERPSAAQPPESPEDLRGRIAELEAKLRHREEQLLSAMTDDVTDLRRREGMFEMLKRDVTRLLSSDALQQLETAESPEAIRAVLETVEFLREPVDGPTLVFGDLAYLKLVNSAGHAAGDAYLHAVGDAARAVGSPLVTLPEEAPSEVPVVAFRYGGDEFTLLLRGSRDAVAAVVQRFRECVADIVVPVLAERRLPAVIDVGLARLIDGLAVFRALLDRGVHVPTEGRIDKVIDLTVKVANRREIVRKGMDRVRRLMEIRRDAEEYARTADGIRAAAYGISDAAIDDFLTREGRGEDVSALIRAHILEHADAEFRRNQETEATEFEAVKAVADRLEVDA